ncbi:twin-arginine translocase TatA/TatE family subunit [Georgenia sp. SUBG003]|uniref:twin-arginine translocase TatA/TatE family subunit n=1 Tax=Georgenia sp. SUBG003 TaxID=1497974 RepID=UPI003AB4890F
MFGINGGELVVLLVLAFLLIGPERLPELAQQLGRLTREVKKIATGAKEKVREELGPEFDDLAALDPRQYDPRRIVREALMDDEPVRPARPRAARRPSPSMRRWRALAESPLTDRAAGQVCRVVVRSCEGILAEVTGLSADAQPPAHARREGDHVRQGG